MEAVPYKLICARELSLIDSKLGQVATQWLDSYYSEKPWHVAIETIDYFDAIDSSVRGCWYELTGINGCCATAYISQGMQRKMITGLIPEEFNERRLLQVETIGGMSILEEQLSEELLTRLAENSARALGWEDQAMKLSRLIDHYKFRDKIRPGSPLVSLKISDDNDSMVIFPDSKITENFLNKHLDEKPLNENAKVENNLESVKIAVRPSNVAVEVQLGSLDLSIGKLAHLSEGDVIRLDKKISDPIEIRIGQTKILEGVLGSKNGVKAIRIN